MCLTHPKFACDNEVVKRLDNLPWSCSIAALLLTCNIANAQVWESEVVYDDILDEYRDVASVVNADGRYFGIYRKRGEVEVWVFLGIPEDSANKISSEYLPAIRVDSQQPIRIDDLAVLGMNDAYSFSPTAFFVKWPSASSVSQGIGFLYDLIAGNTVKARYWTTDGATQRVEFPLTGSRRAISSALSLTDLPSPAQAANNQEMQHLFANKMMFCGNSFSPHVEGVQSPNQDALEACLGWSDVCTTIEADRPKRYEACFQTHMNIRIECGEYGDNRGTVYSRICNEVRLSDAFPEYLPYSLKARAADR